jgi:replication-associated recombination protein RarA
VPQRYLPDEMGDAVYYAPSPHGYEQEIATRMQRLGDEAPELPDGDPAGGGE